MVMMLLVITAAAVLTWIIPSGEFQRTPKGSVVPGSFHQIPKDYSGALRLGEQPDSIPRPANPLTMMTAIPKGMVKQASLIFMILFVGGMFGVFQATGALSAGISRLVSVRFE